MAVVLLMIMMAMCLARTKTLGQHMDDAALFMLPICQFSAHSSKFDQNQQSRYGQGVKVVYSLAGLDRDRDRES